MAQSQAAEQHGRSFGIGQPQSVLDLPPGQLRKDLEGLPAQAKGKALGWLQGFSFPKEDVASLRVSADGSIFYADTFLPGPEDIASAEGASIAVDPSQVFQLHSRPGSSNVVFLDFDGHTMVETAWNYWSEPVLVALPFDPSLNDSPPTEANFTQDELNRIAEIWHRIAEDYAAFDIDVTTEEPAVFTNTTGHLLFTHDVDANGIDLPLKNSGGVAYVNVFNRGDYAKTYAVAFVYYTNLGAGSPTKNGEAGSHEFGHNVGLSHDGITDGVTYYKGHGSGLVNWAPIMGNSYYNNMTQWSAGEYANANNTEDDLAIIDGKLGYVADDHSDSATGATALLVQTNGDILVSSPELDPDNVLTENKGVISDRSDVDWFYIDITEAATLNITATPGWHSFTRSALRGSNLDIELALFDSGLTLVDFADPGNDSSATLSTALTAGRYYIQIDGVGNSTDSDYSDYASMGMFFLEGSIQVEIADITAPSPSTMSWQTAPHATGENSFSMTAVQATDDSGTVEYFFTCVAGGSGCTDSGWQRNSTWAPGGLDADTYYAYKVTARDDSGNVNGISSSMGDTTDAPPPPSPPPPPPPTENVAPIAVALYSPDPAVITKGKTASVTLDGSGSSDPDGTIVAWKWTDGNGTAASTNSVYTVKLTEGTHNFTLIVTDDNGATNSVSLSVSISKGSNNGGRKGKPPKG